MDLKINLKYVEYWIEELFLKNIYIHVLNRKLKKNWFRWIPLKKVKWSRNRKTEVTDNISNKLMKKVGRSIPKKTFFSKHN